MPTYDYECNECGYEMELFQSITESPKRKCPSCGRMKLRRLFGTGAAVMFKGSGFYQTDYRSESYKKAAAADTKPTDSSSSGSSSDSKSSATKSESKSSVTTKKKSKSDA